MMKSKEELFIENLLEIVEEYDDKNFEDLEVMSEELTLQLMELENKYHDTMGKLIEIQGILIFKALKEK